MASRVKINWSNIIAILALLVAAYTLYVAYLTLQTGATEERQKDEISKLATAVSKLSDSYEAQLKINRSLQNSLDSQSVQIRELKNIYLVASGQFRISKKSLSLLINDKIQSNRADSAALAEGIDRLQSTLNEILQYQVNPNGAGAYDFDAKIGSAKAMTISLTGNRYALSHPYQYQNFQTLIHFMDLTHSNFEIFHYKYHPVDSVILRYFCFSANYSYCLRKNDSASSKLYQKTLNNLAGIMGREANKVFQERHFH